MDAPADNQVANLLAYYQAGDGDFSPALSRAILTGLPIIIPYNEGNPYLLSSSVTVPSNAWISSRGGRPTLRQTTTGRLFNTTAVSGVYIGDLIIDGNKANVAAGPPVDFEGATDCLLQRVKFLNCSREVRVNAGSTLVKVRGCDFLNSSEFGVQIDASGKCVVSDCFIDSCASFGIFQSNGAYENEISFNRCYSNGLELIGIKYDCWGSRVFGNHAEGTGDNGISVTGFHHSVIGNTCIGNAHSGIHLYGYGITCTGNFCKNNGKAGGSVWAGIRVGSGFGGRAQYCTVGTNVCVDDQGSPTQNYGVLIGANEYSVWSSGKSVSVGSYIANGANVYIAMSSGTTGSTAPTHITGTVSDGAVSWQFLYTGPSNLNPVNNIISHNNYYGNSTASTADLSGNTNSVS